MALIQLACRCDNALLVLNQLRQRASTVVVSQQADVPAPMEIDAVTRAPGPLTPEERAHRMRNGLCIVCGQRGHVRNECLKSRGRGQ
ncbi:hypothetical protein O9G_001880 [Rozella allomycis CSF55]|uniref:CCHC-type domain-containing protein n=1 Tax=Rozella allomycis (strain CSF55) TaxID=988480 RepID=A0A075B0X3_ROZAC|nr:hypothetical protein O9G_001880 [Rozella allomycis CSF55]|eukprot:EPZ34579.1 hypothetical protein O9G_001880 [Rozella allomycis CSF55]